MTVLSGGQAARRFDGGVHTQVVRGVGHRVGTRDVGLRVGHHVSHRDVGRRFLGSRDGALWDRTMRIQGLRVFLDSFAGKRAGRT